MGTLAGAEFWAASIGSVLTAVVLLLVLHAAPQRVKRALVVVCTFLGGLFYFLEFFLPPAPGTGHALLGHWDLTATSSTIGNATQVVGGFTFMLGVFNLVRIHGRQIRRQTEGWVHSLAFFVSFAGMAVFAFWKDWGTWFHGYQAPAWVNDRVANHAALPHDAYTLLFEGLYRNLDATMFSILAFYIASAAYRAFRVRSGEAAVLMVVALILMMGQVPLGMALTNWIPATGHWSLFRIENVSQYVLTAINSPVQRAIGFGLGLGMLAMSLRIWLSLERGTYFGEEA